MTYGQLKFRLTKAFPGVDLDLIEGWIADRYAEILGELPWSRQNVEAMLLTSAPFVTGVAAVQSGSSAVSLVGATWSSSLNGRAFRVASRSEFYQFTFVSTTTASLDRPYEGPQVALALGSSLSSGATSMTLTSNAVTVNQQYLIDSESVLVTGITGDVAQITRAQSGTVAASHSNGAAVNPLVGYSIFQHIYPLPSNCRLLQDDAFSGKFGPMTRFTHGELNLSDPRRVANGVPTSWASYMDDSSVPPNMQVELYPVPDKEVGIPFTYVADAGALTDTTTIIQIWMQPAALLEGVTAKIKAHLKDYTGAQLHAAAADGALKVMRRAEAQGIAPARMQLDSYYTSHRLRRCR
jgi:hypothetical protein